MKNKYILILFSLGAILTIIGALLKITHFEFGFITGNATLSLGMMIEIVSIIIFIFKIFSTKSKILNQ